MPNYKPLQTVFDEVFSIWFNLDTVTTDVGMTLPLEEYILNLKRKDGLTVKYDTFQPSYPFHFVQSQSVDILTNRLNLGQFRLPHNFLCLTNVTFLENFL